MRRDRSWLYIAVLTLLVAIIWTGVTAVANIRKSTVPPDLEKAIEPLNPNIDTKIFTILQKKLP